MKVLVLGSSGFVGLNYTLCSQRIIVPSNRSHCDVCDHKALREHILNSPANCVVYACGCKNVRQIEQDDSLAIRVNVESAECAAQAALDSGKHFIYISTDYVYEGLGHKCSESEPIKPFRKYSISKAHGEERVLRISDKFAICRMSGACGVKCIWLDWLVGELITQKPVIAYSDVINSPISMRDASKFIDKICELRLGGIYNLAGHTEISRYTLFSHVRSVVGSGSVSAARSGDQLLEPYLSLDSTKIVGATHIYTESLASWVFRYANLSCRSKIGIDRY